MISICNDIEKPPCHQCTLSQKNCSKYWKQTLLLWRTLSVYLQQCSNFMLILYFTHWNGVTYCSCECMLVFAGLEFNLEWFLLAGWSLDFSAYCEIPAEVHILQRRRVILNEIPVFSPDFHRDRRAGLAFHTGQNVFKLFPSSDSQICFVTAL